MQSEGGITLVPELFYVPKVKVSCLKKPFTLGFSFFISFHSAGKWTMRIISKSKTILKRNVMMMMMNCFYGVIVRRKCFKAFYVAVTSVGEPQHHKPLTQRGRTWTCSVSVFRLCLMKLCSSFTTTPLNIISFNIHEYFLIFSPLWKHNRFYTVILCSSTLL